MYSTTTTRSSDSGQHAHPFLQRFAGRIGGSFIALGCGLLWTLWAVVGMSGCTNQNDAYPNCTYAFHTLTYRSRTRCFKRGTSPLFHRKVWIRPGWRSEIGDGDRYYLSIVVILSDNKHSPFKRLAYLYKSTRITKKTRTWCCWIMNHQHRHSSIVVPRSIDSSSMLLHTYHQSSTIIPL